MAKSYRDLIAWQKAIALVTEIYRITRQFPKEEIYGLTSQLRRAAVSIPSNIAEGQSRLSKLEFKNCL
ncbi:MAG: four helix bundle protein, partial [Acidobacteria bacterium]